VILEYYNRTCLFIARTLFWADFSSKRVESATFSGSRTLIYQSMTDNYLRLSVDSNYIYLSTLFSRYTLTLTFWYFVYHYHYYNSSYHYYYQSYYYYY
jgi:hypothetical protein